MFGSSSETVHFDDASSKCAKMSSFFLKSSLRGGYISLYTCMSMLQSERGWCYWPLVCMHFDGSLSCMSMLQSERGSSYSCVCTLTGGHSCVCTLTVHFAREDKVSSLWSPSGSAVSMPSKVCIFTFQVERKCVSSFRASSPGTAARGLPNGFVYFF